MAVEIQVYATISGFVCQFYHCLTELFLQSKLETLKQKRPENRALGNSTSHFSQMRNWGDEVNRF